MDRSIEYLLTRQALLLARQAKLERLQGQISLECVALVNEIGALEYGKIGQEIKYYNFYKEEKSGRISRFSPDSFGGLPVCIVITQFLGRDEEIFFTSGKEIIKNG